MDRTEIETRANAQEVHIRLDAQDVVERVDEMLAWMALAGEAAGHQYHKKDFHRAQPLILVGNSIGKLAPASVDVHDMDWALGLSDSEHAALCSIEADAISYLETQFDQVVGLLGESLCMATITEFSGDSCAMLPFGGGDTAAPAYDYAGWTKEKETDKLTVYLGNNQVFPWESLRFVLDSVSMVCGADGQKMKRAMQMPPEAKLLRFQHVAMLRDGRSFSGHFLFAFVNGRFLDRNRMPMRDRLPGGGYSYHEMAKRASQAVVDQAHRRQEWTVEVSLTEGRTGIGLSTDQIGAREFTNMLRKEKTKAGRSKSLVHWVDEHMRRSRIEGADPVLVRAHMRGVQSIDAGGRHARIYPSRVDIERACNGKRFDKSAAE